MRAPPRAADPRRERCRGEVGGALERGLLPSLGNTHVAWGSRGAARRHRRAEDSSSLPGPNRPDRRRRDGVGASGGMPRWAGERAALPGCMLASTWEAPASLPLLLSAGGGTGGRQLWCPAGAPLGEGAAGALSMNETRGLPLDQIYAPCARAGSREFPPAERRRQSGNRSGKPNPSYAEK